MTKLKPLIGRIGFALLLITIVFIIHSCHKDPKLTNPETSSNGTNFAFTEAREWFDANKTTLASKIKISSTADVLKNLANFTPVWDSARTAVDTNYYVVEAPARYLSSIGFSTSDDNSNINGVTRLLILKSKKYGSLHAVLMQIHGDPGVDINQVHYMAVPSTFSGNIFYTTLQGLFYNGYIYSNGKIAMISSGKTSTTKPAGPQILSEYIPGYCVETTTNWFSWTCYTESDGSIERCIYQYDYTEIEEYCIPGVYIPDGGGGGVIIPLCPPDSGGGNAPVEAYSVNGKKIINVAEPGGGDDGGDGSGGNPCVPQPKYYYNVLNDVKNQCLHDMVETALNNEGDDGANQVAVLIQGIFGANLSVNLEIADVSGLPDSTDAQTGSPVSSAGYIGSVIGLNDHILPNASMEYITATVLHEALHAYMDSQGLDIDQHQEIATNYVNNMASTLMADFPNLSRDDAYGLAWGGLESTSAFTNPQPGGAYIPPGERKINQAYRYPKQAGGKGTSCGN